MPTYNVSKKRGKSKVKISDKREAAMNKIIDSYSEDLDVKMAVIQELIPLGLGEICKELQKKSYNWRARGTRAGMIIRAGDGSPAPCICWTRSSRSLSPGCAIRPPGARCSCRVTKRCKVRLPAMATQF